MSPYVIDRDGFAALDADQRHQVRTWIVGSSRDHHATSRVVVDLDVPECHVLYSGSDHPRDLSITLMPRFVMEAAKALREPPSEPERATEGER